MSGGARGGSGLRWTGAAFMIFAVALGIGAVVWLVSITSSITSYRSATMQTPLDTTLTLTEGQYTIYERVLPELGSAPAPGDGGDVGDPGSGDGSATSGLTVSPEDISVMGPARVPAQVTTARVHETYNGWESVAHVRIPVDGTYRFRIAASQGARADVYVGHGVADVAGRYVAPVMLLVLSGVVFVVGLVVLVVGLFRRRPATPVRAAPGWYPDPRAPGGQRYWNGVAWVDNPPGTPSGPARGYYYR